MLTIRKLNKKDLEIRVKLLNDKNISSYLNVDEYFNLITTYEWYNKVKDKIDRYDCVFEYNDEVIGMGGLCDISTKNRNASLYIYLDPNFHGQGLGTKSLIKLCEYGFNSLKLEKIYLYTFSDNERANHMYEKIGFVREGLLRMHTLRNELLCDRLLYGLLKKDLKI